MCLFIHSLYEEEETDRLMNVYVHPLFTVQSFYNLTNTCISKKKLLSFRHFCLVIICIKVSVDDLIMYPQMWKVSESGD